MNIEIKIVDPENLRLGVFHHFLCQLQTETCMQINWILAVILDFSD